MEQDLHRLQGTWNVVSMEMDGQETSAGSARIVVRGDRFTTIGMGAVYEGKLVVDQTAAPRNFELRFEEGPEKGNTSLGIYELDGDTWKICLTTRGTDRPREFAAPPGSGIALETLQRGPAAEELVAPVVSAASAVPAGDSAAELAGKWVPLSLVRDGQAVPPAMLKYGARIATANEVTVKFGPEVVVQARYAVDRSLKPMTMDYVLADGRRQYGIWVHEDNRLATCFAPPGQPRPGEFASNPGDGRTFAVWKPAGQ